VVRNAFNYSSYVSFSINDRFSFINRDYFQIIRVQFFILLFGATAPIWPGPPQSQDFQITLTSCGQVISSSQRPLHNNTQHSQQTHIHAPCGIRTHNLSGRAAADLPIKQRGHWTGKFSFRYLKTNNCR